MSDDEIMGMNDKKRKVEKLSKENLAEQGKGTSSGSGETDLARQALGRVGPTMGTGEHERPLMEGVLLAIRDLSMDVQDLRSMALTSWELPLDSPYILKAMAMKDTYSKDCREAKGTGVNLGHQKNYVFMGVYRAMRASKDITEMEKAELEEMVGKHLRTDGKLDVLKAKTLDPLIGYCQVVKLKRKAFINLQLRGDGANRLMELLKAELDREGTRQYDAGPPKPIHGEVKRSLERAYKGKGGGKG